MHNSLGIWYELGGGFAVVFVFVVYCFFHNFSSVNFILFIIFFLPLNCFVCHILKNDQWIVENMRKKIKKWDCSASTYCAWLCVWLCVFQKHLFGIEAPASVELSGWRKYFNSYTLQGRRNVQNTHTYKNALSIKSEHLWKSFYVSDINMSISALLQCVLATYGILVVTAAAFLMHRQNNRETSSSTVWKILGVMFLIAEDDYLCTMWTNRRKSCDTTSKCDKVDDWHVKL